MPRPVVAVRRALAVAALAAAVVPATAGADTGCPGADQVPTRATLKQARIATLCLINRERTSRGLVEVHSHARLRKAATRHSRQMVRRHFMAHTSTAARVRAAGYLRGVTDFELGENLGAGESIFATPASMVDAWMHSPQHRSNILNAAFRDLGIGIVAGTPTGGDGATYTTDFGVRH